MIDRWGEAIYVDLLRFYGVSLSDVLLGKGPHPAIALRLVQGLPDASLTVAMASGGRDHYGWGVDRHMQADIFNAINTNTKATGNWKNGTPPKFPDWPRPTSKPNEDKTSRPSTVAALYARLAGKV